MFNEVCMRNVLVNLTIIGMILSGLYLKSEFSGQVVMYIRTENFES
jgi:hypothetical protein